MKWIFILPIVLALVIFFTVRSVKNKLPGKNLKGTLLMIGICCAMVSFIFILLSFYYSRDANQLFKLSMPLIILIIAFDQLRKNKRHQS